MANLIKPTCMKCSKYIACRDPLKGPKYSCKSFTRLKEIGSFEDLYASIDMIPQGVADPDIELRKNTEGIQIRELMDLTPGIAKTKRVLDGVKIPTPEEVRGGVNDVEGDFIWQAMQSSYDPFTNSVRDIKIDDRALKLSTNYYHFCTKIAGSAIKAPFSRQLYVAMILLGEYCPRCTDEKWLDIMNVPVDMESKDLVKRVVLLDNGVCPKCSATKSGLILGGEMKDYNELAIVQGQRCVIGATRLQTRLGFKTFTELDELHTESKGSVGFVKYKGPALVDYEGTLVNPSHFYRSGITKTLKITTSIGQELTGTPDHPIATETGWTTLSDLKVGNRLELCIGQKVYGSIEEQRFVQSIQDQIEEDCCYTYDSTNLALASKLHLLLLNHGLFCVLGRCKDTYRLTVYKGEHNSGYVTVVSIEDAGEQETYDVYIPGTHRFMAEGLLNHNSGKSAFSSTLSAYLLHRYMKAPRMSDICRGIQEFTPLTATFVGLTAARAIKNLWNPFMSIVNGSTWFTDYFEMLRDYGRKYDKELYKRAGLYLRIFHRNLDLYPAPPLKRTLRGDTRFLGATDELSFFNFNPNKNADGEEDDEEKEHADGEEVQQSLSNSLTTVRTEVLHLYKKGINTIPTGYNLSMSSPFSENDTLCRLERDSHNEDSLTFGIRLPTWEVNPLYQRNHPIIVEAYRRNPVKAERDFGANPPQITSALYQPGAIEMLFTPGRPNSHRLLYLDHVKYTRGRSVHVTPQDAYQPAIMTLDAGLVNNAFAMVIAHRRDAIMEVDLAIELVPQPGKQVDFPFLYENIILPIIKDMNVVLVAADRWNSINILQQIEKDVEGCKVTQKTLHYKDFTHFSASVYAGEVKLPALEMPMDRVLVVRDFKKELLNAPISHLALQMTTVKDTGVAIVKGDGYTDDMFRALVLNHQQMFSPKHKTHMNRARIKSSTTQKTDKSRAFVISASRSIYSRGGM